jgi:uncharacterized damage-inducible protein DinB
MEPNPLASAFLNQAVTHLREDFMPKIHRCLDLLNEEEFWQRGSETENSVGNLILHLSGNVRQWIVAGLGGEADHRERQKEFDTRAGLSKEEAWKRLEETVSEASRVLAELDPEELLRVRTIQKYHRTGLQAVFHVVEHFGYHTGQIVFATKLYKHADMKFYNL